MAGAVYIDSGYDDKLEGSSGSSKSLGIPKGFAIFLGAAELFAPGGAAVST